MVMVHMMLSDWSNMDLRIAKTFIIKTFIMLSFVVKALISMYDPMEKS